MRAVGGLLLIFSAFLVSFYLEKGEKRRVRELSAVIDFLSRAVSEIGIYERPLSEIIANFDNETLQSLGFFSEAQGGDLRSGVRAILKNSCLSEADLLPLIRLSETGLPPVTRDAAAALSAAAAELSGTRDFYESNAPRTVRLFRVLAGAGTAIAVLFFL